MDLSHNCWTNCAHINKEALLHFYSFFLNRDKRTLASIVSLRLGLSRGAITPDLSLSCGAGLLPEAANRNAACTMSSRYS